MRFYNGCRVLDAVPESEEKNCRTAVLCLKPASVGTHVDPEKCECRRYLCMLRELSSERPTGPVRPRRSEVSYM